MKRVLVGVSVLTVLLSFAATSAWCETPSSANGLGDIIADNSGRSRGMGGAGLAVDDGWSLLRGNPALVSTFKKPAYGLGFLYNRVVTRPGGGGSITIAHSDQSLVKFVLPLYRGFAIGWELAPVMKTDVKIELPSAPGDAFTDTVNSSGGVNLSTFELAAGFRSVRAGIALDYYFGSIREDWTRDFHSTAGISNSTDYLEREYKGYGVTLGALARVSLVSLGFGYSTPTTLDRSIHFKPGNQDDKDILVEKDRADIPAVWRFGMAASFSDHLTAAADFTRSEWTTAARTPSEKRMYNDTSTFGAGIRYVPSTISTAGYLSTIPLSAGFRIGTLYYKSWPKIESLREMALTFGIEIPFKNNAGGLITSYEIGKRGNADSNGWDEIFMNIGVSLAGVIK
jgi:hypothetical protein